MAVCSAKSGNSVGFKKLLLCENVSGWKTTIRPSLSSVPVPPNVALEGSVSSGTMSTNSMPSYDTGGKAPTITEPLRSSVP